MVERQGPEIRRSTREAGRRYHSKGKRGLTGSTARQDPFGLSGVRDVVAELLRQYAQLDPTGHLNQLAATLAGRLYSRLGA
ncbi:hypothetical protein [Amycolatopsis sp. cmx-11-12]|uniref:hypothetical protein n=1 Tax=Amycolatopsis sp. cmx-11-12 TaxID=2785795 RepID=UPI003917FA78